MRFPSFLVLKTRAGIKCRKEKIKCGYVFRTAAQQFVRETIAYQTKVVGMTTTGEYPWEGKEAHVWPDNQEDGETKLVGKGEKRLMTLSHQILRRTADVM